MFCRGYIFLVNLLIILFINNVENTLTQSDKKSKDFKNLKSQEGPCNDDVISKGLTNKTPKVKDLIIHNAAYYRLTKTDNFLGTTLGYVTPWNSHGYEMAEVFTSKFDLISPVWLQVKRDNGDYKITGDHDLDQGWIDKLRKNNKNIKVLPRILFDGWSGQDFSIVLRDSHEQRNVAELLALTCEKYKLNGLVIELWSQLRGKVNKPLTSFVQRIAETLHRNDCLTVLVIPPSSGGGDEEVFGRNEFLDLVDYVDYFSLMTYDFSSVQRPGPNSPLPWMKACVENLAPNIEHRDKILLGFNFYGQDYTLHGGGPIINNQFIELLKKAKPNEKMKHDTTAEENYIEIKTAEGRHSIFYPTPYSIQKRIELAQELGTGIAIWELGQGLNCFFDLL